MRWWGTSSAVSGLLSRVVSKRHLAAAHLFAAWMAAKKRDPPLRGVITPPRLLQDLRTPRRYVSFAEFDSLQAIDGFRSRAGFGSLIGPCANTSRT